MGTIVNHGVHTALTPNVVRAGLRFFKPSMPVAVLDRSRNPVATNGPTLPCVDSMAQEIAALADSVECIYRDAVQELLRRLIEESPLRGMHLYQLVYTDALPCISFEDFVHYGAQITKGLRGPVLGAILLGPVRRSKNIAALTEDVRDASLPKDLTLTKSQTLRLSRTIRRVPYLPEQGCDENFTLVLRLASFFSELCAPDSLVSTVSREDSGTVAPTLPSINIEMNPTQVITQMISSSTDDRAGLHDSLWALLQQLNETLDNVSASNRDAAEGIAEIAADLVDKACREKPNKTSISIMSEGLIKAAHALKEVVPIAIEIVNKAARSVGL